MSWIFGALGNNLPAAIQKHLDSLHSQSLYTICIPEQLHIVAGGNPVTLHCMNWKDGSALVAGCGLYTIQGQTKILTTQDWQSVATQRDVDVQPCNGQFIFIRYSNKKLECFSDKVGLRTLYFAQVGSSWIFSSRLSWISCFLPHSEINWKVFGARWISFNQLSFRSPVLHTHRLPPNGCATIAAGKLSISSSSWFKDYRQKESPNHSRQILYDLLNVSHHQLNLGLSGGLDSRTLLAVLMKQKKSFTTYSFGRNDDPDVLLSKRITATENIPWELFSQPIPPQDECVKKLFAYVGQSNCIGSAVMSVKQQYYPCIGKHNTVSMDGGGGEVARRQLLNRLAVYAKKDVITLHVKHLAQRLRLHRADIFNADTLTNMESGMEEELDELLHQLPHPRTVGVKTFLDLWSAKVTIPNVACDEQARIDEHTLNFMPFSQPSFMDSVVRLPLSARKNNRLFKSIIKKSQPSLSGYPLIKNGVSYPYHTTMLQARGWMKAKTFFGHGYQDATLGEYLCTVKEFVLDTYLSQEVKECDHYDYVKIGKNLQQYYDGNTALANEVNWWIAFEAWRQTLSNKKSSK